MIDCHVYDMPEFAKRKVLAEAKRQIEAANQADYSVEWLISEKRAAEQVNQLFQENQIDISVLYYPEREELG